MEAFRFGLNLPSIQVPAARISYMVLFSLGKRKEGPRVRRPYRKRRRNMSPPPAPPSSPVKAKLVFVKKPEFTLNVQNKFDILDID